MAELLQVVRVQQAKAILIRQLFDNGAGHAQMHPNAFLSGQGMLMYQRMHNAGGGIHGGQAAPAFLSVLWQCLEGEALMREMRAAALLGRANDVIAGMGKRGGQETAVIMPLRPDIGYAVTVIIGKAKDMAVATGRLRMDAVGTVQLAAAPPTTGTQEILGLQLHLVLEDEKTALRHFTFQSLKDFGWGRILGGKVHPGDLRANRIESGQLTAIFFNDVGARRVYRWKFRCRCIQ